jgi:hypothetical protein
MKTLILFLILCSLACSTGPRVPCMCQRNLNDCLSAYQDSPYRNQMSKEAWADLCERDINLCEYNRGVYH